MNSKYVEWELTGDCNLACVHCRNEPVSRRHQGPSEARCFEIADVLVDEGCRSITLSGGEPLLCEHWHTTARRFRKRGVSVQLVSNGWLLDEDAAKKAEEAGVSLVFLSLDGPRQQHDLIRNKAGSFARVIRAAKCLEARGVPFGFITTVVRSNQDHLDSMVRDLVGLEPSIWQIWAGIPPVSGKESSDLWLRESEIRGLRQAVLRLQLEYPVVVLGDNLAGPGYQCRAGSSVFGIDAAQRVSACLSMGAAGVVGRIGDAPLRELFEKAEKECKAPRRSCRCMVTSEPIPRSKAFSHAAAALLFSGLAVGCSGTKSAPEPKKTEPIQPAVQDLSEIPSCCLSHMLVPDCVCSWKPWVDSRLGVRMSVPSSSKVENLSYGVLVSADASVGLLSAGKLKLVQIEGRSEYPESNRKELRKGAVYYSKAKGEADEATADGALLNTGVLVVGDKTFAVQCSSAIAGDSPSGISMLPWCEYVLGSIEILKD